jgi:RNA polymerase sigma-70 factor (ECF subfamily)
LKSHLDGDEAAFREIMRAYQAPVYGYLSRCGVPRAERDDLFQEIFLRVHKGAESLAADRALRPWLFTIAVNTTRSYFRKRKTRSAEVLSEAAVGSGVATDPGPDAIAEGRETAHWIEDQIAALPETEREVLILCCLEHLPQAEVSQALSIPLNTIKTHLRRARLRLARQLARRRLTIEREGTQ